MMTKPRPRILLDVDGIFADFITPCLDAIFAHTGKRFQLEDITSWDIIEALGIDAETGKAIFKSMQVPGFCMSIPAYPGAREGVDSLREWADVWAVTSPFGGDHWMHERDRWMVEKMGFTKYDVLHVRGERKHGVFGDAFVEDKTATLREWHKHWPEQLSVLFARNYNANDGWDGVKAYNWEDLVVQLENRVAR